MATFLRFIKSARPKEKKTDTWTVVAIQSNVELGKISWWAHWRKYVFSPKENTIFDVKCLQEIITYIDSETKDRNRKIDKLQKIIDNQNK